MNVFQNFIHRLAGNSVFYQMMFLFNSTEMKTQVSLSDNKLSIVCLSVRNSIFLYEERCLGGDNGYIVKTKLTIFRISSEPHIVSKYGILHPKRATKN